MALWGGRFSEKTDDLVAQFSESISYDRRLYPFDILGSQAHARMLARQGIIPQEDADAIVAGLDEVREEIENGTFVFKQELEDIHMNVEARLTEKIGKAGERLHTGRSRNDRSRQMNGSSCATNASRSQTRLSPCRRPCLRLRRNIRTSSCPVSPTCNMHSRFCLRTIFWHTWRCTGGTWSACGTAAAV